MFDPFVFIFGAHMRDYRPPRGSFILGRRDGSIRDTRTLQKYNFRINLNNFMPNFNKPWWDFYIFNRCSTIFSYFGPIWEIISSHEVRSYLEDETDLSATRGPSKKTTLVCYFYNLQSAKSQKTSFFVRCFAPKSRFYLV